MEKKNISNCVTKCIKFYFIFRVYSVDLVHKFQREGWTCDDCKCCLICGDSQTNVSRL